MNVLRSFGVVAFTLVIVIACSAEPSQAQLLGQVSTARTLVRGANDVGGYIGLFEDFTTVFGQYRHGLSSSMDVGVQFGIADPDARNADAGLIIGGDLKFNVMSAGYDPLDMALGLRTSYYDISHLSVFGLGGAVILSRDYPIEGGGILAPYGSVNIRLEHTSYNMDSNPGLGKLRAGAAKEFDNDDTSLEISGTAGVKWELSDFIDALGEIVLDEDWGLILGLNFKL